MTVKLNSLDLSKSNLMAQVKDSNKYIYMKTKSMTYTYFYLCRQFDIKAKIKMLKSVRTILRK